MQRFLWAFVLPAIFPIVILSFFINYVSKTTPTFYLKDASSVELGISIIEQDFSTISNQSDSNSSPEDEKTTSFLLQSPNPTAQIYLDYVAIRNEEDAPLEVCFKSIIMPKNEKVPFDIIPEVVLGNLTISSTEYKYDFPSDTDTVTDIESRCIGKGAQKLMPHVLLGIVPVDAYVEFPFGKPIYKNFDAFPFDEKRIELNLRVEADELEKFSPSINVVIDQEGWTGGFNAVRGEKPILYLHRHPFFQFILILFVIIMLFIVPLLNGAIDEPSSFFEVAFSLLLGLWGMNMIMIPGYIQSSLVIDGVFYVLYIIVLFAILQELIRLSVSNLIQKSVRIKYIEYDPPKKDIDGEFVEITNKSILSVNMTDWLLFDKARNNFKFPPFTLNRKSSVKIWVKGGQNDRSNLYWGSKKPIWNNDGDIATLEDNKGKVIDIYSYVKK